MPTQNNPKNPAAVDRMATDPAVQAAARELLGHTITHRYSYNFSWLGVPIIQYPQDIFAVQEIIWNVKPDLIIETGIAHGGSLIFSASLLELLGGDGLVLGIDVDIRQHNRDVIEAHPMAKRIRMIEGSSVAEDVFAQVRELSLGCSRVMVMLDSNHTHEHVAAELKLYSPLVTVGSYLVVFDTVIEDMASDAHPNRPWGIGNSPKSAVHEFLKANHRFEIDSEIHNKLLITVCPDGYLRCVG